MTQHHTRRKKQLKTTILVLTIVSCVAVATLAFLVLQIANKVEKSPVDKIQDVLLYDEAKDKNIVTFESSLGFSVSYNQKQLNAVGYVIEKGEATTSNPSGLTFKTYDKKDVLTARDYSIANFYDARMNSKENIKSKNYSKAQFDLSTNINEDFFEKRKAQYGAQLSEIELVEKHFQPKTDNLVTIEQLSTEKITLHGVEAKKVVYQETVEKPFKTTSKTESYYFVKNNKPYVFKISRADDPDRAFVDKIRSLIDQTSFGKDQQSTTYGEKNSKSDGSTSTDVKHTSVNVPKDLKRKTALEVVAKNQPATVRVGAVYCSKVTILLNQQPYMTLEKACTGGTGSGSIISQDGYISTNGHVVTFKPSDVLFYGLMIPLYKEDNSQPIEQYLQYLSAAGVLEKGTEASVLASLIKGEEETISQLASVTSSMPSELLKADNTSYEYAIQLGKEPLRLVQDGAHFSFTYKKDQIVKAKLIDKDFNEYDDINYGLVSASDVALLKVTESKNSFPVSKLGSVDGLKKGDLVTAIGFPGFVDGGLDTKQKYTFPSATQGKVRVIGYDSSAKERKIITSSTPIAGGNSGGPAFSENGTIMGLNTYGYSNCADDSCFGSRSIFRDVADLKKLVEKNDIALKEDDSVSVLWSKGVDAFSQAKYGEARNAFVEAKTQYPSFYLADSFLKITDEQLEQEYQATMAKVKIGIAGLVVVVTLGGLIVFVRKLSAHNAAAPVMIETPVVADPPLVAQDQQQTQPPQPVQYTPPVTSQPPTDQSALPTNDQDQNTRP